MTELHAFGINSNSYLGIDSKEPFIEVLTPLSDKSICSVSAGANSILFLNKEGKMIEQSEEGIVHHTLPVKIKSISCGYEHYVSLSKEGKVYVFGSNRYGQLGIPKKNFSSILEKKKDQNETEELEIKKDTVTDTETDTETETETETEEEQDSEDETNQNKDQFLKDPYLLDALRDQTIKEIFCQSYGTFFLNSKNELLGVGYNDFGCLGIGTKKHTDVITKVMKNVSNLYSGISFHSIARTHNNEYFIFGYGGLGQLGLGDYNDVSIPRLQPFLCNQSIKEIVCGEYVTLILTSNSQLYSTGLMHENGFSSTCSTFQSIPFFRKKKISKIACGYRYSIAVDHDGSIYTFGPLKHKFGQDCNFIKVPFILPYNIFRIKCGTLFSCFFEIIRNNHQFYSKSALTSGKINFSTETARGNKWLVTNSLYFSKRSNQICCLSQDEFDQDLFLVRLDIEKGTWIQQDSFQIDADLIAKQIKSCFEIKNLLIIILKTPLQHIIVNLKNGKIIFNNKNSTLKNIKIESTNGSKCSTIVNHNNSEIIWFFNDGVNFSWNYEDNYLRKINFGIGFPIKINCVVYGNKNAWIWSKFGLCTFEENEIIQKVTIKSSTEPLFLKNRKNKLIFSNNSLWLIQLPKELWKFDIKEKKWYLYPIDQSKIHLFTEFENKLYFFNQKFALRCLDLNN
ncbi:hypothetical protein M0812_07587 [Anaeramoeba flamelloides]|uniref:Regulator of chromosome condensation n=1 Tax=Anaeramoeba flamelloides TaxID=1746091 RepID=A0AAV7ZZJ4_9EUKA|nr:hypothetical protein M0812_07587 [Anaeramoeba flamelloides]